jgi:hypothetical protein
VENWPRSTQNTRYDEIFKSQCPDAYSWQFDDVASKNTCIGFESSSHYFSILQAHINVQKQIMKLFSVLMVQVEEVVQLSIGTEITGLCRVISVEMIFLTFEFQENFVVANARKVRDALTLHGHNIWAGPVG